MPLTFEGTRAAGATLGSGVIMLFDDTIDLGDIAAADRLVLPGRIVRAVRAVPHRHDPAGRGAAPLDRRSAAARRPKRSWR